MVKTAGLTSSTALTSSSASSELLSLAAELCTRSHAHALLTDEESSKLLQDLLQAFVPAPQPPSAPLLPPSTRPHLKTLVLDIDGTLLSSLFELETTEAHGTPDYQFQSKNVWLRPGVRSFLQACRPFFEVCVFTAATQDWADRALAELDPTGELIDHRLYREHTTPAPGWDYVKDLSRLGRDLRNVVIVDDNELMFQAQPHNAIWVHAFEPENTQDDVLDQVLQMLLLMVLPAEDVTACIKHFAGLKIMPHQSYLLQLALAASEQASKTDAALAMASADGLSLDACFLADQFVAIGDTDSFSLCSDDGSMVLSESDCDADADTCLAALLHALASAAALPAKEQLAMAASVAQPFTSLLCAPTAETAPVTAPLAPAPAPETPDAAPIHIVITAPKAVEAAAAATPAPDELPAPAADADAASVIEEPAVEAPPAQPSFDAPAVADTDSVEVPAPNVETEAPAASDASKPTPTVDNVTVDTPTAIAPAATAPIEPLPAMPTPLSVRAKAAALSDAPAPLSPLRVAVAVAIAAAAVRSPSLKRRRSSCEDSHYTTSCRADVTCGSAVKAALGGPNIVASVFLSMPGAEMVK